MTKEAKQESKPEENKGGNPRGALRGAGIVAANSGAPQSAGPEPPGKKGAEPEKPKAEAPKQKQAENPKTAAPKPKLEAPKQKPDAQKPEAKAPKPKPIAPKADAQKPEAKAPKKEWKQKSDWKKQKEEWKPDLVFDATDAILGRLATQVAKASLDGKKVSVINAEKAVISGRKSYTIPTHRYLKEKVGSRYKGPFYANHPEGFVKRTIRGMLPWEKYRGREASRRIRVFMGAPDLGVAPVKPSATIDNLGTIKFITVGSLCKRLGWKGG